MLALEILLIVASCTLSASAGMGGSLILIPSLALVLGPKEAVAAGALILGANNVFKVVAYRATVPVGATARVALLVLGGGVAGSLVLVRVPEAVVSVGIVAAIALAFATDVRSVGERISRRLAGVFAFLAGACSGFSGTSGPMKGVALKSLGLDRAHLVGAASLVSLVGDVGKAVVLVNAGVLSAHGAQLFLIAAPLMPIATFVGRKLNQSLGEASYQTLFWLVMTGYSARLLLA